MIVETLLVKSDGSQSIIQKEVPDNWFDTTAPEGGDTSTAKERK